MKLEQQVVSLELAKRLKELGVKQESLFAYYGNAGVWHESIVDMGMYTSATPEFREAKLLPAYTVAELGEMLPNYHYGIHTGFNNKKWRVTSSPIQRGIGAAVCPPVYTQTADTEADARASMLIYLIENNLINNP